MNIRALNELFHIKEEKEKSGLERVTVKLLMVEIYNEVVLGVGIFTHLSNVIFLDEFIAKFKYWTPDSLFNYS